MLWKPSKGRDHCSWGFLKGFRTFGQIAGGERRWGRTLQAEGNPGGLRTQTSSRQLAWTPTWGQPRLGKWRRPLESLALKKCYVFDLFCVCSWEPGSRRGENGGGTPAVDRFGPLWNQRAGGWPARRAWGLPAQLWESTWMPPFSLWRIMFIHLESRNCC